MSTGGAIQFSPVRAAELRGLPCDLLPRGVFPRTDRRCRDSLKRLGVGTELFQTNGGAAVATRIELLPEETRIALLQRRAGLGEGQATSNPELWQALAAAPAGVREEAERRLRIVRRCHDVLAQGFAKRAALRAVAGEARVSVPTLNRWLALIDDVQPIDWLPALAPAYKPGGQAAAYSAEAWDAFLADQLRPNQPRLATSYKLIARIAEREGWAWPSIDTIRRKFKRDVSEAERVQARNGGKAAANLFPPQHRDVTALHAMQRHNYDGFDPSIMVEFEDGYVGRPCTFICMDIYSKKILAAVTDKTENTDLFRFTFAQVSENFGYPEWIDIDNTRAAANKTMTGGVRRRFRWRHKEDDPLGILPALDIKVHFVTPGLGRTKPVERAIRDVKELTEYDLRAAPAYCGDNPRERDGRKPQPIPLALYLKIVQDAVNVYNSEPGRRNAACEGKLSFDEVFTKSYAKSPIRLSLPEHREYWLYAVQTVRCRKERGEISVLGNRFWAPELVNHRGTDVAVRFDPQNVQSGIIVEALEDGRRICTAPCIAMTGYNDTRAGREYQRHKKAYCRAVKESLEAKHQMTVAELVALMGRTESAAVPAASVVKIVRPKERLPAVTKPAPLVPQEKMDRYNRNLDAALQRISAQRAAGM